MVESCWFDGGLFVHLLKYVHCGYDFRTAIKLEIVGTGEQVTRYFSF